LNYVHKSERTTLVLPIVGHDIKTISSGNSAVLWFGLDLQSPALVLNI